MERTSKPASATAIIGTVLGSIGTAGVAALGAKAISNNSKCNGPCGTCNGNCAACNYNCGYVHGAYYGPGYYGPGYGIPAANALYGAAATATDVSLQHDLLRENEKVSKLESKIAELESKMYTDATSIATFKESSAALGKIDDKYAGLVKDLNVEAVNNRIEAARNDERLKCLAQSVDFKLDALSKDLNYKIDMSSQQLGHAIEVESERRATADNTIRDWCSCTFVPYKKVIDSTQLCPPVTLTSGAPSNATQVYWQSNTGSGTATVQQ